MNEHGVKSYFIQYGMKVSVSKETSLCNSKLSDNYIYYLAEGIASLTSLTKDGNEKDFLYFPAGNLLGFVPTLMRHYRKIRNETPVDNTMHLTSFGIGTKTDCIFYRISEPAFESLLDKDPIFASHIMEATTRNFASLVMKFQDVQEEAISTRLYQWLLTFSQPEGCFRAVPRGFTYADIAKYLGVHPVTVSKLASELKKKGIIKKEQGRILIVDEKLLKELL
ncbi:MAG: Crp/Fnr family transcriptional regulator [Lachnospiraceae bacterium]